MLLQPSLPENWCNGYDEIWGHVQSTHAERQVKNNFMRIEMIAVVAVTIWPLVILHWEVRVRW